MKFETRHPVFNGAHLSTIVEVKTVNNPGVVEDIPQVECQLAAGYFEDFVNENRAKMA